MSYGAKGLNEPCLLDSMEVYTAIKIRIRVKLEPEPTNIPVFISLTHLFVHRA